MLTTMAWDIDGMTALHLSQVIVVVLVMPMVAFL